MADNDEKIVLNKHVVCLVCGNKIKEINVETGTYKNSKIPRSYIYALASCPHCNAIIPVNITVASGCVGSAYSVSETDPSLD